MTTEATATTTPAPGGKRSALEAAKLGEDIKGKVFIITGAYSGIGVETAKALLAEGGKIVIGGRNPQLLETFSKEMKDTYTEDQVDGFEIDLGDLESVKKFAEYILSKEYKDIRLICNAGVMNTPKGTTKSGYETQMGINVIGHFLLAKLLVGVTARQIWLSSLGHTMNKSPRIDIELIKKYQGGDLEGYDGWAAYQQSKLGNVLLPKEFAKRYPNIEAVSVHPGGIATNLARHTSVWGMAKFMATKMWELSKNSNGHKGMKSVKVGASTTVTCATLPLEKLVNGGYYEDCGISTESESAKNEEDAKALFDFCEEATMEFQAAK